MTIIQDNKFNAVAARCLPPIDPCNPTNASTTMQGGKAVFENDNYRITADDDNTVTINNKHTGETYQAWGDPHMKIDGKDTFDFWGTTTLRLEDGTKVTIETTPWANDPSMTLSSKVTITNGNYGARITGIDSNKTGDLKIDETKGWGEVLDAAVSDGNVLQENPAGKGFLAIDKSGQIRAVDQTYINETDLKKGGACKQPDEMRELFRLFSTLLSVSFRGQFMRDRDPGEQPCKEPRDCGPRHPVHTILPDRSSPNCPINSTPAPTPGPQKDGSFIAGKGDVVVDIKASDSGYDNKIYYSTDGFKTKHQVGIDNHTGQVNLGSFPPGTRIDFGIVNGNGELFRTGDDKSQANVVASRMADGGQRLSFEDIPGGGDRDFNDAIFEVREKAKAASTPAPDFVVGPTAPAPAPAFVIGPTAPAPTPTLVFGPTDRVAVFGPSPAQAPAPASVADPMGVPIYINSPNGGSGSNPTPVAYFRPF
jgi:hypothetical protein